jgi:type IV pilus assembly protein PilO
LAPIDLKSPAAQKALLAIVAGVACLAVYFCTHFLPFTFPNTQTRYKELKAEYDKKSTELSRARATVADLPRFEAEYAQLHQHWLETAELLPTERQLPALMRKITLAAQQNGVGFMAFRPGGAKAEEHYTETPLELQIYGNYHQVGSFLADMANMRRIVTVSNLKLKTNTKMKSVAATTSAELTASAYHLTTSSTQPKPAPEADAAKKEEDPNEHEQGS